MTVFILRLNTKAVLATVPGYITKTGSRGSMASTAVVRPGGVLGKRCLICMGSTDEGGEFIFCPRCLNVYHLSCIMELGNEPVCPQCGRPLRDVMEIAKVIKGGA